MESTVPTDNLKVGINNRQILSIALPITFAILIPQLNMLINSIFLGRLSASALGNAGITGVYYLIFAVAGTFEPFQGYGLIHILEELFGRDH